MSTKHTPGPWEHTNDVAEERFADIEAVNGGLYIRASWGASTRPVKGEKKRRQLEMEANARLIAAAPDLLEALQQAHIELASIYHTYRDVVRPGCLIGKEKTALQYVIDAIAKATGAA